MGDTLLFEIVGVLAWGLIATVALSAVSFASQNFGWSRLNFPLLLGTLFTQRRRPAMVLGFILFILVGWLLAFAYYVLMLLIGQGGVLVGIGLALVHGLFVLVVALPLLPYVHPYMASAHDGPGDQRHIEPPGFLALHYGSRTPLVVLAAYAVYGALLGLGFSALD